MVASLQQNVEVMKCNSRIHFPRYLLICNDIFLNLHSFNFFVTLVVSDWYIWILCLRKFLTENMKWILKKKSQQISPQVNRKEDACLLLVLKPVTHSNVTLYDTTYDTINSCTICSRSETKCVSDRSPERKEWKERNELWGQVWKNNSLPLMSFTISRCFR